MNRHGPFTPAAAGTLTISLMMLATIALNPAFARSHGGGGGGSPPPARSAPAPQMQRAAPQPILPVVRLQGPSAAFGSRLNGAAPNIYQAGPVPRAAVPVRGAERGPTAGAGRAAVPVRGAASDAGLRQGRQAVPVRGAETGARSAAGIGSEAGQRRQAVPVRTETTLRTVPAGELAGQVYPTGKGRQDIDLAVGRRSTGEVVRTGNVDQNGATVYGRQVAPGSNTISLELPVKEVTTSAPRKGGSGGGDYAADSRYGQTERYGGDRQTVETGRYGLVTERDRPYLISRDQQYRQADRNIGKDGYGQQYAAREQPYRGEDRRGTYRDERYRSSDAYGNAYGYGYTPAPAYGGGGYGGGGSYGGGGGYGSGASLLDTLIAQGLGAALATPANPVPAGYAPAALPEETPAGDVCAATMWPNRTCSWWRASSWGAMKVVTSEATLLDANGRLFWDGAWEGSKTNPVFRTSMEDGRKVTWRCAVTATDVPFGDNGNGSYYRCASTTTTVMAVPVPATPLWPRVVDEEIPVPATPLPGSLF